MISFPPLNFYNYNYIFSDLFLILTYLKNRIKKREFTSVVEILVSKAATLIPFKLLAGMSFRKLLIALNDSLALHNFSNFSSKRY